MGNVMGNGNITPDYSQYLGGGSFGHVYKGTYGGQNVAVKAINRHMLRQKYRDVDRNEIIPFLKELKHPNVISILAWQDKGHELWLALELCDSGLDRYARENDLSVAETINILRQGAYGLAYLHKNHVIHRDIRPDNMLVLMVKARPQIKLTDFSLCKDVGNQVTSSMTTVWGNPYWRAPELLLDDGHGAPERVRYKRSIDVFSFGLVIIYVCVNNAGREKINRTRCAIVVKSGGDVFDIFEDLWRHKELQDKFVPVLRKMLHLDPDARSTMNDIALSEGPQVAFSMPSLKQLASHGIGYEAHWKVGIGGENYVLLCRNDTNDLCLLQMRDGEYHQVWKRLCPSGLRSHHDKFVLDGSIITRYSMNDPTQCWDLECKKLHEHLARHGDCLVAVCPVHTMVYTAYNTPVRGYEVHIYDGRRIKMTLNPPSDTKWDSDLSVCQHETTSWFAVCESKSRSVDIYDKDGSHRNRVALGYEPNDRDAICCTDNFLIISEHHSLNLHFHTWLGSEVYSIHLGKLAWLNSRDNRVCKVAICKEDVLHVAVGRVEQHTVYSSSLYAFRIQ